MDDCNALLRGLEGNVTIDLDLRVGDLADHVLDNKELVLLFSKSENTNYRRH